MVFMRFTSRDWMWLTVVVTLGAAFLLTAQHIAYLNNRLDEMERRNRELRFELHPLIDPNEEPTTSK